MSGVNIGAAARRVSLVFYWGRLFWARTRLGRIPKLPSLVLLALIVAAMFAPWIAPSNPRIGSLADRYTPPIWQAGGTTSYLLGTDHLGRDILTRIIFGARVAVSLAGLSILVGAVLGSVLGMVAGYFGRWLDELIMRLTDTQLAIPPILIALMLAVVFGPSMHLMVGIMVIWMWPNFARVIRGETLKIKAMDYVALARIAGAGNVLILVKHVFPQLLNTIIVLATVQVGLVILLEATLSFLGVGIPRPTPAWGSMIDDGRSVVGSSWWVAVFPGVAVMLTVLSVNLLGDWLRDALDPKLRQI